MLAFALQKQLDRYKMLLPEDAIDLNYSGGVAKLRAIGGLARRSITWRARYSAVPPILPLKDLNHTILKQRAHCLPERKTKAGRTDERQTRSCLPFKLNVTVSIVSRG